MSEIGRFLIFVVVGGLIIAAIVQMSQQNDAFERYCRAQHGAIVADLGTNTSACRLPSGRAVQEDDWLEAHR